MPTVLREAPAVVERVSDGFRLPLSRHLVEILEQQGELVGRYELIDGELIKKMGQKPPHSNSLHRVFSWFYKVFTIDYILSQSPIEIAEADRETNYVEPDVTALSVSWETLTTRHPEPHEVALAVEIADFTLQFDRIAKAPLYARAGIVEYWIVDVNGRAIFVHRNPENGQYQEVTRYAENERVSCLAKPDTDVLVSELIVSV